MFNETEFEWDKGNSGKNLKHKVENNEAEEAFFDKNVKTFPDPTHSKFEDRFILLGKTKKKRLLYIVFTRRKKRIRIISARDIKGRCFYMKKRLNVPKFKNEDQERDFWSNISLADYFEPSDFKSASFPNLKPTSQPISIRIPQYIVARVKQKANEIGIPYQALIKQYIAEGVFGKE